MVEVIIFGLGLALVVMMYGRISKSLDWAGKQIEQTSDMISDVVTSGTKQTARGVILSHDTLLDTVLESQKREAKRTTEQSKFEAKLTAEEKKSVDAHAKYLAKYINR